MEEQETIANELAWLRAENQQLRAQLEKLTAQVDELRRK